MPEVIPCDDCEKPCGIYICTGCYEKAKSRARIEEMKKAIRIAETRQSTARGLNYEKSYLAAYDDLLVFLKAELYRMEHPDYAAKTRTVLD